MTADERTTARQLDGLDHDTEPLRPGVEVWPTTDALMHAAAERWVAAAAADLDSRGKDR